MGIPLEFIEGEEQIDSRLICSKCCMILETPCSTKCGHYCCSKCIQGTDKKAFCHKCHSPLALSDNNKIPDDLLTALHSLSVKCTLGCQTVVNILQLDKHLTAECQLRVIQCVNRGCTHQCTVQSLDEHYKECMYTLVQCTVCNITVTKRDMPAHQAVKKCFEQQLKRQRVSSARRVSADLKSHRSIMLHQRHLSDQHERYLVKQHYEQQRYNTTARPLSASQSIQSRIGSALVLPQLNRAISTPNTTSCGSCENKFLSGRKPSARRHSHSKVSIYMYNLCFHF